MIRAVQKRKTKMRLKCRTTNRHFVLFCGSANMLISRENMGPEGWYNSYMTKSRIAFSSSRRIFPGFCAWREQQKPSNVITGIAKLLGGFSFSPTCKGSATLSCPGVGHSWTQGASAGRRVLLQLICQEPGLRLNLQEEMPIVVGEKSGLTSRRR